MQQTDNMEAKQATERKLLVVDDNPAMLETAKAMFADGNWQCLTRQDSVSGLCAIVEHHPEAVLIDSEAAPLDAWKFTMLVKEHAQYCRLKVIVVSREDTVLIRAKAQAACADALLVKPFSAEEVKAVLGPDKTRSGMAA